MKGHCASLPPTPLRVNERSSRVMSMPRCSLATRPHADWLADWREELAELNSPDRETVRDPPALTREAIALTRVPAAGANVNRRPPPHAPRALA